MSDQREQHGLSFTAFVLSLASTAAIHFGDLPDPTSGGPAEPNLAGAAQMIEILALLDQKTRGNLTAEERQVLERGPLRAPPPVCQIVGCAEPALAALYINDGAEGALEWTSAS